MPTTTSHHRFAVVICSTILPVLVISAMPDSSAVAQPNYGDTIEEQFDIADVRIGSRDADRSGSAQYTAPSGFTILGHSIHRVGHHSGVSHVDTTQPGRLTYQSSAMASLRDVLRRGFLDGTLSMSDNESSSATGASGTAEYLKFLRNFEARYHFVADTHASITFSWFADSKSFDHGAHLVAHATIRLRKAATEADAERAAELIRFALDSNERAEVFELIDSALGVSRPSN